MLDDLKPEDVLLWGLGSITLGLIVILILSAIFPAPPTTTPTGPPTGPPPIGLLFVLTPFIPKPKPIKPKQTAFAFAMEKEPRVTTFDHIPQNGYFRDLAFRSFRNVGGGFAMDSDADPNAGKLYPFSPDESVITEEE